MCLLLPQKKTKRQPILEEGIDGVNVFWDGNNNGMLAGEITWPPESAPDGDGAAKSGDKSTEASGDMCIN